MYLKVNNKKIDIVVADTFLKKFKSFKFYLPTINFILKLSKKRFSNTYFFCQVVDIIQTDKNEKIVYLDSYVPMEKSIFPRRGCYNTYFLPKEMASNFKVGDTLKLYETEKKNAN